MKRWGTLQHELRALFVPGLRLDIQCGVCRMASNPGQTELPRYWVSLARQTIWDYPKDFPQSGKAPACVADISAISDLLRLYIGTPRSHLLHRAFAGDRWGITDIMKAADRRLGLRRLEGMRRELSAPALKVLAARAALGGDAAASRQDPKHSQRRSLARRERPSPPMRRIRGVQA